MQSVLGCDIWWVCLLFLQELIEVDSDVVFELASYILQVGKDFDHKLNIHNCFAHNFFSFFLQQEAKGDFTR